MHSCSWVWSWQLRRLRNKARLASSAQLTRSVAKLGAQLLKPDGLPCELRVPTTAALLLSKLFDHFYTAFCSASTIGHTSEWKGLQVLPNAWRPVTFDVIDIHAPAVCTSLQAQQQAYNKSLLTARRALQGKEHTQRRFLIQQAAAGAGSISGAASTKSVAAGNKAAGTTTVAAVNKVKGVKGAAAQQRVQFEGWGELCFMGWIAC